MPRLIAYGCSYTQGAQLDDNYKLPTYPSVPSKFAWPQVLADKLGLTCVNRAEGGSGNLEILWKILNSEHVSTDTVCIGWSHFNRDIVFDVDNTREYFKEYIRVLDNMRLFKTWLQTHSEHDVTMRTWINVHHANCFLKMQGVKVYNLFCGFDSNVATKPEILKIDNIIDVKFVNVDYGHDNSHPGIKSNSNLADSIYKYITEGQAGP